MCCEHCFMSFVRNLFENNQIKSVKSDYVFGDNYNVEFIIEYNKGYNKKELLEYIKKCL